jgi:hypothetical protein
MTAPLLQTKIHIPPLRPELVPRLRLIERETNDHVGYPVHHAWLAGCGVAAMMIEGISRKAQTP